jgi:hypothetical protein
MSLGEYLKSEKPDLERVLACSKKSLLDRTAKRTRNPYYASLKPALGAVLRVSSDSATFSCVQFRGAQKRHLSSRYRAGFELIGRILGDYSHGTTALCKPCPDRRGSDL